MKAASRVPLLPILSILILGTTTLNFNRSFRHDLQLRQSTSARYDALQPVDDREAAPPMQQALQPKPRHPITDDVEAEYNTALAEKAIRPTPWICGDKEPLAKDGQRPFFAFVHIYKTAGSTLRDFFSLYASLCRKSMMTVISCTGVKAAASESRSSDWNDCRVKNVVDGRRGVLEYDGMGGRTYLSVNNTALDGDFDFLAGHYRMGSTDGMSAPARHITFLRQPKERYVSGVLYRAKLHLKNKRDTVEDTAKYIKKLVREGRSDNRYSDGIYKYLLTPEQSQNRRKFADSARQMEHDTRLVIENLVKYNTIVGMTERMQQSMQILRHVLLPSEFSSDEREERVHKMFEKYTAESKPSEKTEEDHTWQNRSSMGDISTSSVMAELRKDDAFMQIFEEYVKYEQRVVDYALRMHIMQYDLVSEGKDNVEHER